MGLLTAELIDVLDQLAYLLESDGATDWCHGNAGTIVVPIFLFVIS